MCWETYTNAICSASAPRIGRDSASAPRELHGLGQTLRASLSGLGHQLESPALNKPSRA